MKKLKLLFIILLWQTYAMAQEDFVKLRMESQDHIAIVIGNSDYPDMPLKSPKNDAEAVAETLTDMGFIVEKVIDADREKMAMAIENFINKLSTSKAAIFYFAGQGIHLGGKNYLMPTGRTPATQIKEKFQIPYQAIHLGDVLSSIEQNHVKFSMVVLDVYGNNPIKGLAPIEAPNGSIIMYASKAEEIIMDSTDTNSPFTRAFVQHMKTPGLDVSLLPLQINKTVHELTDKQQIAGAYTIKRKFCLLPPPPDSLCI